MPASFGENLRLLRMKRKLSQVALAARLGVSQKLISAYERDYRIPPSSMIPRVAEELGVSTEEIFRGNDTDPPPRPRLRRETLWRIVEKIESLPNNRLPELERVVDAFLNKDTAVKQGRRGKYS